MNDLYSEDNFDLNSPIDESPEESVNQSPEMASIDRIAPDYNISCVDSLEVKRDKGFKRSGDWIGSKKISPRPRKLPPWEGWKSVRARGYWQKAINIIKCVIFIAKNSKRFKWDRKNLNNVKVKFDDGSDDDDDIFETDSDFDEEESRDNVEAIEEESKKDIQGKKKSGIVKQGTLSVQKKMAVMEKIESSRIKNT